VAKKALLIGSEIDGLTGVENDVESMAHTLRTRDFAIERCLGNGATRAGILAAYERLIVEADPGDAVAVYYSGHGGSVAPPDSGSPGPDLMDMQFILPVDYHDSVDDDFRGITSVELSVLLGRLTQKTHNVVAVLDCCYAGHMSRDGTLRLKSRTNLAPYDQLRAHIDKLRGRGLLDTRLWHAEGNRDAVRIVACAPQQSAFEHQGEDGKSIGILTESLTMALAEAGTEKVTWATVMDRVRRTVLTLSPGQRPEVEGPSRRLVFDTAEEDALTTLRVTPIDGDRVRLECAPLLGVQPGDEFMIMPPGTTEPDDQTKIGNVSIDRLTSLAAEGPVAFSHAWTVMPLGARAHRVRVVAPALPVRIPTSDPRAADLMRAVSDDPFVRLAEPREPYLAEVRIDAADMLTLHDQVGPLYAPRPADGVGTARVMEDLKILAQATALRSLAGDRTRAFGAPVIIEWGRLHEGQKSQLATSGAVVHTSDRIYIRIRNDGQEPIYVSLIDIGVSARITVLTRRSPSGERIEPGKEYAFGYDDLTGAWNGAQLSWPQGLNPAAARTETVLVLVTSDPQDVSPLEQGGISRSSPRRRTSALDRILDQVATAHTRDIEADAFEGPSVRYDVHTVDFELAPLRDEGQFLIDERPDPPVLLRTAKTAAAPMTVAVRLEELVVHRNRALFGADIRVDAIILTGRGHTVQPVYRAQTERFSNIRNDMALPLDRMLVYHGPAVDYLDLAVWVSRDATGSLALSDLLADALTGTEVQDALTAIGGAVLAASPAAEAAVIVGAGAVIINVAYKLLRGAVGNAIGLYRGSRLAQERFGVGRHPQTGTRRVQDFSFAYTIEDVT
jgi:hypothetical protein